jgi:hypothetical protein
MYSIKALGILLAVMEIAEEFDRGASASRAHSLMELTLYYAALVFPDRTEELLSATRWDQLQILNSMTGLNLRGSDSLAFGAESIYKRLVDIDRGLVA